MTRAAAGARPLPRRSVVELLPFLLLGAFLAGALAFAARTLHLRNLRLLAGWRDAAGQLGLRLVQGKTHPRLKIAGEIDGVAIEVHALRRGGGRRRPAMCFAARSPGIPADLSIRWEGLLGELRDALGRAERVRTGNESFDEQAHVSGPEAATVALLDRATRARLTGVLAPRQGTVAGGTVAFTVSGVIGDPGQIVARARELAELARRLSLAGRSVPELLRGSATTDPLGPVRQRSLEVLVRYHPAERDTDLACEWTVKEGTDPAATLMAARHLRAAGWPYLQKMVDSPAVEDALRVAALEHLIASVPGDRLVPMLEAALGLRCRPLHPPALRALERLRPPGVRELVVGRLNGADEATAVAAAEVLGDLGDAGAEPALLGLMGRDEPTVRAAAATALGKVGTRRAVELLFACSRSISPLREGEVRQALSAALEQIRGRLGAAEPGRLSVAGGAGEAGALSVVGGEGGLSLASGRGRAAEAPPGTAAEAPPRSPQKAAEPPGSAP